MGMTVPEVIGDGHPIGHNRDRIGVVSDADRVPPVKRCIAVRLRPEDLPADIWFLARHMCEHER